MPKKAQSPFDNLLLDLARKAREKASSLFTVPQDVRGVADFLRQQTTKERERQKLPGVFDALPAAQKFVADSLIGQAADTTSIGGAALNALDPALVPAGAGMMLARKTVRTSPGATKALAKSMADAAPEGMREAARYFAERYPRIFSHVGELEDLTGNGRLGGFSVIKGGPGGQIGRVSVNTGAAPDFPGAVSAMGHELTHLVDAIKNAKPLDEFGHFNDASGWEREYTKLLGTVGYPKHPMEMGPRAVEVSQLNRAVGHAAAQKQPVLPHVFTPQTTSHPRQRADALRSMVNANRAVINGPDITDVDPLSRQMAAQQTYTRLQHGELPSSAVQGELFPQAPPKDQKPRPEGKNGVAPSAAATGWGNDDGLEFDISNLASSFGVERSKHPAKLSVRIGKDKATVTIKRWDKNGKPKEPTVYDVPVELGEAMRKKSFDFERGILTNATGKKHRIGP